MTCQSHIPPVTLLTTRVKKQDLHEFGARHFLQSNDESEHSLMAPVTDDEHLNEDGLGYYPDGTKRTLTDQQIEIFRHSEIQKLQRAKRWKEMADRDQQADVECLADAARGSLTDADRLEGQGGRQDSLEHEENGFQSTENSCNNLGQRPKEGITMQDGNNIAESPPLCSAQGTTSTKPQKPTSSPSNPFGRRLVSYDD
ncbi:hypothetical protein ACJ72_06412 [Emergomyces africanus]|uniref:Uncharacterized protein n=1 Tax=Emergomyces africanus TaxID=1955775 RepID=A0A1B7NRK9_9EURO|nr:hypothetical protein ACJ72_06412 [Emergomyces africanus]